MTFDQLFDTMETAGIVFDRLVTGCDGELCAYAFDKHGQISITEDGGTLLFTSIAYNPWRVAVVEVN